MPAKQPAREPPSAHSFAASAPAKSSTASRSIAVPATSGRGQAAGAFTSGRAEISAGVVIETPRGRGGSPSVRRGRNTRRLIRRGGSCGRSGLADQQHLADVAARLEHPMPSAASAIGTVRSMIGRISPAASSGQTCSRTDATIAAFSSAGRARSDVEITAPRLRISRPMSSSAFVPPCMPMMTRRPLGASTSRLRARYFAPMLSSTTSAPRPSVASRTAATKSSSR